MKCLAPHVPLVEEMMDRREPLTFLLLGFPFKAPNADKVLGTLPDMAEEMSLRFLRRLCDDVAEVYEPGARIILGGDGRALNDLLEVSDSTVTAYTSTLKEMLALAGCSCLEFCGLDDLFPDVPINDLRALLPDGEDYSIDALHARVLFSEGFKQEVNGMTRFLNADLRPAHPELSNTKLQILARERAYQIIQRGEALRALFRTRFPRAIRLSIHPQLVHGTKLGIHITQCSDAWMSPWHGTAVQQGGTFTLMRRSQALELGGQVVPYACGRPSHIVLN